MGLARKAQCLGEGGNFAIRIMSDIWILMVRRSVHYDLLHMLASSWHQPKRYGIWEEMVILSI